MTFSYNYIVIAGAFPPSNKISPFQLLGGISFRFPLPGSPDIRRRNVLFGIDHLLRRRAPTIPIPK